MNKQMLRQKVPEFIRQERKNTKTNSNFSKKSLIEHNIDLDKLQKYLLKFIDWLHEK